MKMGKIHKILLSVWWGTFILALLIVVAGESDLLPNSDNTEMDFLFTSFMILITIGMIPLALRLFKTEFLAKQFKASDNIEGTFFKWAVIRLAMIEVPLIANTLLYYIYMNVSFGYMAIILLLSSVFIYPSKGRCEEEIKVFNG